MNWRNVYAVSDPFFKLATIPDETCSHFHRANSKSSKVICFWRLTGEEQFAYPYSFDVCFPKRFCMSETIGELPCGYSVRISESGAQFQNNTLWLTWWVYCTVSVRRTSLMLEWAWLVHTLPVFQCRTVHTSNVCLTRILVARTRLLYLCARLERWLSYNLT